MSRSTRRGPATASGRSAATPASTVGGQRGPIIFHPHRVCAALHGRRRPARSAATSSSCEVAAPEGGIANILFTSGSTGRPKGIEITTRSLLHFSHWAVETFALHRTTIFANHAPYSFDLSTLDVFAAVRAGARHLPGPRGN